MKNKGCLWRAAASVLCLALAAGLFHFWSLDGLDGFLLSSIDRVGGAPEDTEYARGYTYFGFRRVKVGMSEADVQQLLGPPLSVVPRSSGAIWIYSRTKADGSYRVRVVDFHGGVVLRKIHEYYPD